MISNQLRESINQNRLGAHLSIAKGYASAAEAAGKYGSRVLQIFTRNATTWKEKTVDPAAAADFENACRVAEIETVISHASYLINLAGTDPEKRNKSIYAMTCELERSRALSIPYVVVHPGSHMGEGETAGIRNIADALIGILSDRKASVTAEQLPMILLETTAGQGQGIGHTFESLSAMLKSVGDPGQMGICLDTCHIFAAGYDLRTPDACEKTFAAFDRLIGLKHLKVLHLNDSKIPLGGRVDRHAHIGEGEIGLDGFRWIMCHPALKHLPKILETPRARDGVDMDSVNYRKLLAL